MRLFLLFKKSIEHENNLVLILDIVLFISLWIVFCLAYRKLLSLYPYLLDVYQLTQFKSLIDGVIILMVIGYILCGIFSICALAELISRTRCALEKRKNNKSNQSGFAYIDVLIGMTILAVALTALAGVFIITTKSRSVSDHKTMATRIIQAQFNDLQRRAYPINDPRWAHLQPEVQKLVDSANAIGGPGNVALNLNTKVEMIPLAENPSQVPATSIQGIRTTVSWTGPNGQKEQVSASNYFYTAEANFSGGLTYVSIKK
ncbi:hypothetical protein SDC9_108148 [bioreactor metagenome]|uniref:Uncharacterized protein n=1 Tax=bioreactor metagenome TaxID=1076179 RepID=A0A645B769_9ZZZZ